MLWSAARLCLRLPSFASVSDAMRRDLHWLNFPNRVTYKLCIMAYMCQHELAPVYLRRYCVPTMTIMGRAQLRLHQLVCCLLQEQEQLNSPDRNVILLVQEHGTACQSGWGSCLLWRLSRKASKLICLICEFVFRFRQFHSSYFILIPIHIVLWMHLASSVQQCTHLCDSIWTDV